MPQLNKHSLLQRLRTSFLVGILVFFAMNIASAQVLYESGLSDGGKDWTPVNNASVSEVSRRAGGKSLLIKQLKDSEADSAWLGPVLKNPGKPIQVSLWAADNYAEQKDYTYAAGFEIVPCKADGSMAVSTGDWTWCPWDDKRQIPQFRHTMTREGLRWKYYSAVKQTQSEYFRVKLCWPKALSRGECYFTDVRVATLAPGTVPLTGTTAVLAVAGKPGDKDPVEKSRFAMEISTAANGNLFFAADPLRFEFLLFSTDGQPLENPKGAEIVYEVQDFEHFMVASGRLPFSGAKPSGLKQLGARRAQNLQLSFLLPNSPAREVGRHFFLTAHLMQAGRRLASDTTTYTVVNPNNNLAPDISKSRFIAFGDGGGFKNSESKNEHQNLPDKMGVQLGQSWDYEGWKKAQPEKNGPITIAPGKNNLKLVYCPNLEQVRGRKPGHPWGDMATKAPSWAVIDDPFQPGCKTFEIDAYVEYIVAYIRANRSHIAQVVPSGLERVIDARTLELQRKAYAAIKREFPDLAVGMMTWGVADSAQQVDLVLKEKLYLVADFFNTHVYQAGGVWTEWERLQRELKKLGLERPLISTEFAYVGGGDQLQSSRNLITSMLDAHAHGMYRITYFLMYAAEIGSPLLEKPIQREEVPGDGFQWMQYVDRPRVSSMIQDQAWNRGRYGTDSRGASLMPTLKTAVYYNFVQAVEGADFKTVFRPTPQSIAYVYERAGKTICYLFLREPGAPQTLALNTELAYSMQDIYGRVDQVKPQGVSLVVATQDPLLLQFEGVVPELAQPQTALSCLRPIQGGLELPTLAAGTNGTAVLKLPDIFPRGFEGRLTATVDGSWPQVKPKSVTVKPGKTVRVDLPISVLKTQPAGTATFTTRLYRGDQIVSVLKQPFTVEALLSAQLGVVPMSGIQEPAITLTLRSLGSVAMKGTVNVSNPFFGTGFEATRLVQPYTVAPGGVTKLRFPVPREQVNLATGYEVQASVQDSSGFTLKCEDDLSFQACVQSAVPITVDGDLSDWNLKELTPIPYEKWFNGPRAPEEFSGHFFTRWDKDNLYFVAEITDKISVITGTEEPGWNDDNIMFSIYPWGWRKGEALNAGYYREHLGPIVGGKAAVGRFGNVPSGPGKATGVKIAVKRTANGYIYEWAYPLASLHPLELKSGGAFRLAMSVWDQRKPDKKDTVDWGEFSWLTFSGFNTSVNSQPNLWRQFTLVP